MTVYGLSHVCLGATDLPRTIAFYQALVEAEIVHEFRNQSNELYGVFLSVGHGTFLEFFKHQEPSSTGGLFRHFCLRVDDIEDMANRAKAMGFKPEIKRSRSDRVLQFWITDPDGTGIEFHEYDEQAVHFPFLPVSSGDTP